MTAEIPQFGVAGAAAQERGLDSGLDTERKAGEAPRSAGFASLLASAFASEGSRPDRALGAFPNLRDGAGSTAPGSAASPAGEPPDRPIPPSLGEPLPASREIRRQGPAGIAETAGIERNGIESSEGEAAETAGAGPFAQPGSQPRSPAAPAGPSATPEDSPSLGKAAVSGSGQAAHRGTLIGETRTGATRSSATRSSATRTGIRTNDSRPLPSTHPADPPVVLPGPPPPVAPFAGGSGPAPAIAPATPSVSPAARASSASSASPAATARSAQDAAPGLAGENGKVSPIEAPGQPTAVTPEAGKRDTEQGGGKSTAGNAVESAAPLHATADPVPSSAAHASWVRPSAGSPEAATAVDPARGSASPPLRSANPYAKLDEGAAPTLVHASAQRVAVAVHDPVLGDLQVRAQAASNQVQASLSTGSAASHAQLSGQLPSLAHFLAEQRVAVARLSVDRELGRELDRQMGGSNAGTAPGTGGGGQPSGGSSSASSQSGRGDGVPVGSGSSVNGVELAAGPGSDPGPGSGSGPGSRDGGISAWSYIDVHA
jgi:hypothetical protein